MTIGLYSLLESTKPSNNFSKESQENFFKNVKKDETKCLGFPFLQFLINISFPCLRLVHQIIVIVYSQKTPLQQFSKEKVYSVKTKYCGVLTKGIGMSYNVQTRIHGQMVP